MSQNDNSKTMDYKKWTTLITDILYSQKKTTCEKQQ